MHSKMIRTESSKQDYVLCLKIGFPRKRKEYYLAKFYNFQMITNDLLQKSPVLFLYHFDK